MERFLKIFACGAIGVIIIAAIIIYSFPPNRMPFEEQINITNMINSLNNDLPRNIGTIGTLDSIKFRSKTIIYYMTVSGDPGIIDFYKDHYQEFNCVAFYAFATLNGQNNNASRLAEYENLKGIKTQCQIFSIDGQSITWDYSANDFLDFLNTFQGTPTDAISTVIDFQIALENYRCQSVSSNALSSISGEGCFVKSLEHTENCLIWTFVVDEKDYCLSNIISNANNPSVPALFMEEMVSNSDAQELVNMISISHSDLKIKYEGASSHKTLEILIPYSVIKNYSQVPFLNQ